jgi:hypothetical protein
MASLLALTQFGKRGSAVPDASIVAARIHEIATASSLTQSEVSRVLGCLFAPDGSTSVDSWGMTARISSAPGGRSLDGHFESPVLLRLDELQLGPPSFSLPPIKADPFHPLMPYDPLSRVGVHFRPRPSLYVHLYGTSLANAALATTDFELTLLFK